MSQLTRKAKSASDWTANELFAYNIDIKQISPAEFFQNADPSFEHLDPAILTSPASDIDNPNVSNHTAEYLTYLSLAKRACSESAIDDFAAATLRLLGFAPRGTAVATRYPMYLTICGENRLAQTDVCVFQPHDTMLLNLVEDKSLFNNCPGDQVEAQVVAVAIAAFQFNNSKRQLEAGQLPLEAMTIPCITMSGTTPSFYLIPVTKDLSDAVIGGRYPTSPTQVLMCMTTAMHPRQISGGMADIEFRKISLQHFLAFRDLAKTYWQQYIF